MHDLVYTLRVSSDGVSAFMGGDGSASAFGSGGDVTRVLEAGSARDPDGAGVNIPGGGSGPA